MAAEKGASTAMEWVWDAVEISSICSEMDPRMDGKDRDVEVAWDAKRKAETVERVMFISDFGRLPVLAEFFL